MWLFDGSNTSSRGLYHGTQANRYIKLTRTCTFAVYFLLHSATHSQSCEWVGHSTGSKGITYPEDFWILC